MTAPADLTQADASLVAALKLIAERPEILRAALALANSPAMAAPAPAPVPVPPPPPPPAHAQPMASETSERPTVGELWDQYAPWAQANIRSWKSMKTNGTSLRKTLVTLESGETKTLFDLPWWAMTPDVADRYRAARVVVSNGRRGRDGEDGTICQGTINREITTLRSMLKYHYRIRRVINRNPLDGVRMVDERQFQRQTYLTPEQAQKFIESGCPMWQDLGTVAYRCAGMRATEARLLRKSEVDFEAKVINLPSKRSKNRTARVIPFPDDVEKILRHHCDISRGPYVFVSTKDPARTKPVSLGAMQCWLKKAQRDSGLVGVNGERIVFHSLRHAGVTELINRGAPEHMVKAAAGMCGVTFVRYNKFNRPQQEILRHHMNGDLPPVPPPPGAGRPLVVLPGGANGPGKGGRP